MSAIVKLGAGMAKRPNKPNRQTEIARRALRIWNNEMRPYAPKCGAKAKSTGAPCRREAMSNGRCSLHGGRTPKGDGWHEPRWPKNNEAKLHRKIRDLERARQQREARLSRMTDNERSAYEKWHEARRLGSAARRQAERQRRQQNSELRERLNSPVVTPSSAELIELEKLIAKLEAEKIILERGDIFG
ncbi:hypothetical protein [Roseibium aggregatum]|uniref:hypothetical protein n=1 Tax=Roseibium aggregatum TaxID=187304 RepID=UPI001E564A13|nr:hypothetical protein [Roseibium aggregatum]UES46824.1 hypothetical protein GFK90_25310 [Roseibium aggregatum]